MGNNRSKPFLKWINVITCNLEQKYLLKAFLGYVSSRNRVSWQNGMHSSTEFFRGKLAACIKETFLMPLSPMLSPCLSASLRRGEQYWDRLRLESFIQTGYAHNTDWKILEDYSSSWVCVCVWGCEISFLNYFPPPNMSKGAWHLSWQWHEFCSGLSWRDFNILTSRLLLKSCFPCLVVYFRMNV